MTYQLWTPCIVFSAALLIRLGFFLFGLFQDAYGPLPYTDIDYFVFTDAARYVYNNRSPYERETYRYTPLLAWWLLPTAQHPLLFSFGKILFSIADVAAGWLLYCLLQSPACGNMPTEGALKFASIWLLNPMVATISTRGSSEGLLGVMVIALLWAMLSQRIYLAGFLLGLAVHFKIYPFIYGVSFLFFLAPDPYLAKSIHDYHPMLKLLTISMTTFAILNAFFFVSYGDAFMEQTYLHHLSRLDHRHNFSPYNTLLHLASSRPSSSSFGPERLALLPQLLLTLVLLPPLTLISRPYSLATVLLAQTFAFVTFNKVCTSQYFLWYLVLLPLYLPRSRLLSNPALGFGTLFAWIVTQGAWLYEGWRTEFKGDSSFVEMWLTALSFLGVNCFILGVMVWDIAVMSGESRVTFNAGEKHKASRSI